MQSGFDSESQSPSSRRRGKRNSASFQGAYLLTRVNTSPLLRRTRAKKKSAAMMKEKLQYMIYLIYGIHYEMKQKDVQLKMINLY